MDQSSTPYDCGAADSYYRRGKMSQPHKRGADGKRVFELSKEEEQAYRDGFTDNEHTGHQKDYG